jgi:uncharacterized protein (UPF0212 family)
MYKCPNCKKKIDKVIVESVCTQDASIDDNGKVSDWQSVDVGETLHVYCPECNRAIKGWSE